MSFEFKLLAGSMLAFFCLAGAACIWEETHPKPKERTWVFAPILEIDVFVEEIVGPIYVDGEEIS